MRSRPRQARQGARRHGGADASGARRARLPRGLPRRTRCWWPTAATPPSGRCSTTRCACRTRCSRPSSSACSAPAWRRRSGAAVARPGKPVCCIIGDGAMGFHPQEVETAVRNDAQVIYIVLCDKQWGMVKMNQQFMLQPVQDADHQAAGARRDDQGRPRRDRVRQAGASDGRATASASPIRASSSRRSSARWRRAARR